MRRTRCVVRHGWWPLLLLACDDPAAPAAGRGAVAPHPVAAVSLTADAPAAVSHTIPLHFIRSDDCSDELVELGGVVHLVSQVQPDGSVLGHINYRDVTGVGLTSGTVYHASAVDQLRLAAPFPSSIHSERTFRLVSVGADDNLLVDALLHVTVTADGDVAASIDELRMRCEGATGS